MKSELYEDPTLRQTGRTMAMLRLAMTRASSRQVVIVCADARDVDRVRKMYHQELERIFKLGDEREGRIRAATSFVYDGEPAGYGRWPNPPLVFVDHWTQTQMVRRCLERMGM